jgi:hypothetical protein
MIIAGMNVGRMLVAKLPEYKSEKISLFDEDDSQVVIQQPPPSLLFPNKLG